MLKGMEEIEGDVEPVAVHDDPSYFGQISPHVTDAFILPVRLMQRDLLKMAVNIIFFLPRLELEHSNENFILGQLRVIIPVWKLGLHTIRRHKQDLSRNCRE